MNDTFGSLHAIDAQASFFMLGFVESAAKSDGNFFTNASDLDELTIP